jgi:nickel-dependent lactate racemase
MVARHEEGVEFLRTTSLEKLSGLADAVITSAAGFPIDLTFYQTIKGLTAAQHIVKPGKNTDPGRMCQGPRLS